LTSSGDILNPSGVMTAGFEYAYLEDTGLMFINNVNQLLLNAVTPATKSICNQITAFYNGPTSTDITNFPWLAGTQNVANKSDILTNYVFDLVFLISDISPPGYGVYYTLGFQTTDNVTTYPAGQQILASVSTSYFDKNGKVFTQNTSITAAQQLPFYFKWSHYSPIDQRIDPSPTNIIDMVVITNSYYTDIVNWSNNNGTLATIPLPPTTEDLRIQFQDLDQYKMVSDSMIWNSGTFKLLFGPQASPELQAVFMVVKSSTTSVSDNEVKTQVITAINTYFNIQNWDFGETFFYTELAAYIHQQLSTTISSVVIVPTNSSGLFGNLFEIVAGPTELFLSTATVNNVQIVSNLTNTNLRT
jgi:hypothetical protein